MKLFLDQYNNKFFAENEKDLKKKNGFRGRVEPMYIDKKDGRTVQIGFVIGDHWFSEYALVEKEIK